MKKSKKYKRNDKIEAAIKKISSLGESEHFYEKEEEDKAKDEQNVEDGLMDKESMRLLVTPQYPKKSSQDNKFLNQHHQEKEIKMNSELIKAPPPETRHPPSSIEQKTDRDEKKTLDHSMSGSAVDGLATHEIGPEQGEFVESIGLFQENGVYHTHFQEDKEKKKSSPVDHGQLCVETEDGSDRSDLSLVDVFNDDLNGGSISSKESDESDNEAELLAMKNKEMNKDILRELYLNEIGRKNETNSESISPISPVSQKSQSLSRKTSSVNFSEHDCVQEFEVDDNCGIIPISMDPDDILLDNSQTDSPKSHSSFIFPAYTQQSKMSKQKNSKKKGGFLAALKKKKTTAPTEEISTENKEDKDKGSEQMNQIKKDENEADAKADNPVERGDVGTKEKTVDSSASVDKSNDISSEKVSSSTPPELERDKNKNPPIAEPINKAQGEDEIEAAKEKLTRLLQESPEFRASVLSLSKESPDSFGKDALKPPLPRQPDANDMPITQKPKTNINHNKTIKASRQKFSPKPGSHIEDSVASDGASSEESSVQAETRSATFRRLTQPKVYSSPSVELAKPPPESGTKVLDIPCGDTKMLVDKNLDGKSFVIDLDPNEEKLSVKVKATECSYDWEYSNKLAYYGLSFNRCEFMEFDDKVVPSVSSDAAKYCSEESTQPNGRVKLARGLSEQKTEKKKLLISHEDAFDFLFINRIKLLRKVRPHLAQMDVFCNKYFFSFICLVFDLKMQLLGTYDHKLGKYFPGIMVCPPHVQRQKRRRDNHRFSNLLEVDFNKLPVDTFAIVPVICDVSPKSAEFPAVHLQLDVAVNSIEDNFRRLFESSDKNHVSGESSSDASSLHEQFDVENAWQSPESTSNVPGTTSVLPEHIDFLDANWAHVESFFVERLSSLPNQLGDGPKVSINQNQTRSQTITLTNRSSYVPFVIFRRYSNGDEKAMKSGERLWSLKGIQKTFDGVLPHIVSREVLELLKHSFITPIHHINVEHCMNCERHKSTTWHVPGSYEKRFEDLCSAIQTSLPPCAVTSNKYMVDPSGVPRMGAFDITVRPFFSDITQLLHSKVISKQFPSTEKVISDLATLLLPEKVTFKGVHTLELHVYDGYNRVPLKGAFVRLYRIDVNPSCHFNLSDTIEDLKKKPLTNEESSAESGIPCAANNWLIPRRTAEDDDEKKDNEKPNQGLPQIPRDSHAYKKKRDLGKGFTTILAESKSLSAARFRHSKSFFNVRTWRKQEVSRWIQSYGLSQEVVDAAAYDGAVDGPSFLSIASAEAFQRWGIKSRIKLTEMVNALEDLKQDHTGNMVTSYDPYTYNELLEGAADRHTPSPQYSEPAQPRESAYVQDVTYHPVGSKRTDGRGLSFMNVDILGSYMLRIEAPYCASYCSNVFQINSSGHSAFCASLKPKIGLAKFSVKINAGASDDSFEGVEEAGILLSMVNIKNGKRHITVVKYDNSTSSHDTSSLNKSDKNKDTSKPKLSRQQSAGIVLMNEVMNHRKKSSRAGSVVAKSIRSEAEEIVQTKQCKGEIWLPVGKYYSEVDGAVFSVTECVEHEYSDDSWSNKASRYCESEDCDGISSPFFFAEYTEEQTRKCHRRLVMSSVRAFQKIYRRYKKSFLRDNLWAFLTLKRSFRNVLKRIRGRIKEKRAVVIQRQARMLARRRAFCEQKRKILLCQTVARRRAVRKYFAKLVRAKLLIKAFFRRWLARRRIKLNLSATKIQLLYRRVAAREVYLQLLFHRRLSRRARRYVGYIRRKIAARKFKEAELAREDIERRFMEEEERLVLRNIQLKEEYEREVIRQKLLAIEAKRRKKATILQKNVRGFTCRLRWKKSSRARRHRLYLFEQQLENKPKNLSSKQKFVAYCPGFPALKNNPELLGATKLLQGMSLKEKPVEEIADSSPDNQNPEGSGSNEPKKSFMELFLHKFLDTPATKIQSALRMRRDRLNYIEWWQHCHESEEFPPLYRHITKTLSVHADDEAPHSTNSHQDHLQPQNSENQLEVLSGDVDGEHTVSPFQDMTDEQLSSLLTIQRVTRGHLARCKMPPRELHEVDDDISAITKASIAKSSSFALPLRQLSNVSNTFSKTIKRGLSSASLKNPSSSRKVRELKRSVSSGMTRIHSATSLLKEKYDEKAEAKKEMKAEQAAHMNRLARLENHEVNVEDAILHISGWDESELPRLNRKWYVAAFPLLAGEGPEKIDRMNKFKESAFYQSVLSKRHETYEDENEHLEYEMSNNRFPGEAVRTVDLAPFTRESFHKLNFNVHLADYTRYTRVHVVVFLQTGEDNSSDSKSVRTDALPRDISVPTIRKLVINKKTPPSCFLPAFHGTVNINQGKAFTPCGGRINVNLDPISSQAIYLSRAQAKRLALLSGIRISATLSPVAVPGAPFLYSLLCKQTPPPAFPSEVLDAISFEKRELDLKEFYGAAICMTRFKGRNLVSTRHRGMPHGVLEFNGEGEVIGRAVEHQESMGTITSMTSGFDHLMCCGSTGFIAIYVHDFKESDDESVTIAPPPTVAGREVVVENYKTLTCIRSVVDLHSSPIISCTVIHRAGMDIFFTLDKSDNIGVIIMEKGICLRTFLNESFVTYHISSFVASLDRLYLGLSTGIIVTINLSTIMNGDVDAARNLQDHILGRDVIFSKEAGITSMTILSQADFFGVPNEDAPDLPVGGKLFHSRKKGLDTIIGDGESSQSSDERQKLVKRSNKQLRALKRSTTDCTDDTRGDIDVNPKCDRLTSSMEGHILFVAGGDQDPRIKALKPLRSRKLKDKDRAEDPDIGFGFREIYSLPGHERSTTQMVADAAGRFLVTVSQGSREMSIWNILTENCERTHHNIHAAYMGLSNNAIFMCSFKAPFLTIWRPREPELPKMRYRRKVQMPDGRYCYEPKVEEAPSVDGRPEIAFVRGNVWCVNTIQGGLQCPNRSLAETTFFLNGKGRDLVHFWKKFYDRGVKTISKLPPPLMGQAVKMKKLNPRGVMAKGLRSKIKEQRRELQRSASQMEALAVEEETSAYQTPHDVEHPETIPEGSMGQSFEDDPNYNSYYGCYYDDAGNPYNYDEQGNLYYYYSNVSDTPVKDMAGYCQEDPQQDSPDNHTQISHEPKTTSSACIEDINSPSQELGGTTSGELFNDSYHTSSQYDDRFNDESYDENFEDNNGLHSHTPFILPVPDSFSNSGVPARDKSRSDNKHSFSHLPKIKNPNLDSYGYNIKGDFDSENREEADFEDPSNSYAQNHSHMTESGIFVKRNPLSNRRRHMHMSDSEESDDERLTSIYKAKRREQERNKEMATAVSQINENSYGFERELQSIEDSFDQKEKHGYEGVHDDMSNIVQEDSFANTTDADSSIISIANERKKMLTKRQQLLKRRVLYQLDGDDSD